MLVHRLRGRYDLALQYCHALEELLTGLREWHGKTVGEMLEFRCLGRNYHGRKDHDRRHVASAGKGR